METSLIGKFCTRPEDATKRGKIVAVWHCENRDRSLLLAVVFKGEGGSIAVLSYDKIRMLGS